MNHPSTDIKTSLLPSTFLRKENDCIVPFICLCTPTTALNIAISTITND
jgi:hypothetical protein